MSLRIGTMLPKHIENILLGLRFVIDQNEFAIGQLQTRYRETE
jgi:hypothetical protein